MAIEWLLSGYCVAIEWLQPGHDEKWYYTQAGKEQIVLEVASGLPQCVHPRSTILHHPARERQLEEARRAAQKLAIEISKND